MQGAHRDKYDQSLATSKLTSRGKTAFLSEYATLHYHVTLEGR